MGAYDGSGGDKVVVIGAREALAKYYGINPRLIHVPLDEDIRNGLGLPEEVIRATADRMCHFSNDDFSITDEELTEIKTFRQLESLWREKDRATL